MAPPSGKSGTRLVHYLMRPLFRYIIVVIMTVLQRSHDLANTLGLIMIKFQYCGGIYPSHRKAIQVNLKTTFPVHKSSFCVRILLPLSLLLLLINLTRPLFRYIIVVIMTVLQGSHDLAYTWGWLWSKFSIVVAFFHLLAKRFKSIWRLLSLFINQAFV